MTNIKTKTTFTIDIAELINLVTIDGSRDDLRKALIISTGLDQLVVKQLTLEQLIFIQDNHTNQEQYETIDNIVFSALRMVMPEVDMITETPELQWEDYHFYNVLNSFFNRYRYRYAYSHKLNK